MEITMYAVLPHGVLSDSGPLELYHTADEAQSRRYRATEVVVPVKVRIAK